MPVCDGRLARPESAQTFRFRIEVEAGGDKSVRPNITRYLVNAIFSPVVRMMSFCRAPSGGFVT